MSAVVLMNNSRIIPNVEPTVVIIIKTFSKFIIIEHKQ